MGLEKYPSLFLFRQVYMYSYPRCKVKFCQILALPSLASLLWVSLSEFASLSSSSDSGQRKIFMSKSSLVPSLWTTKSLTPITGALSFPSSVDKCSVTAIEYYFSFSDDFLKQCHKIMF